MTQVEEIEKAAKAYTQEMIDSKTFDVNYEEDNYDAGLLHATSEVSPMAFKAGVEWATKSEDNVTLSFHVCNIPCPEEVMAGANAKYEAYFVSVPKNLIPDKLLEVITKDSNHKYISQVALLKDGLV